MTTFKKVTIHKFFTFSVIALLSCVFIGTQKGYAFAGGDGSSANPYQISDCAELNSVNNKLNGWYELTADIDCLGADPGRIGTAAMPFTGNFNGGFFTISNVTVTGGTSDVGLFGATSGAKIYNLNLDNFTLGGINNVGALVGIAGTGTTISHIYISDSDITGSGQHVGGIVGYLGGSFLTRSHLYQVSATGDANVGGIVGTLIGPASLTNSVYMAGLSTGVTANSNAGGIAGQSGPGPSVIENTLFDEMSLGSTLVGSEQSSVTILRSHANPPAPFTPPGWNYTTIMFNSNPYATPRPFPQIQCQAPTVTTTTMRVQCSTDQALWPTAPTATWEIQYAFAGSTEWTSAPDQTGLGFDSTINSALPGTDYQVRFRFIDEGLTSSWGTQDISTPGNSDVDGDGVSNKDESLGPNNGDSNNDGTLDYTQGNVIARMSSVSNKYIVLQSTCTGQSNVSVTAESGSSKDTTHDYPAGLIGFTLTGCGIGSTATVTQYYFGTYDISKLSLRKWQNNSYKSVSGAIFTNVVIGGQPAVKVVYQITDGSSLDNDGTANGTIVDPVGIALAASSTNPTGAPNTGFEKVNLTLAYTSILFGLITLVYGVKTRRL